MAKRRIQGPKLPCKIVLTSKLARQLFGRDSFEDVKSFKTAMELVDEGRVGKPIRLYFGDSITHERYVSYGVHTLFTDSGAYNANSIESIEFLTDDVEGDGEIVGGESYPDVSFVKFDINSTATFDTDKGARGFKESKVNRGTRKLLELVHADPRGFKLVMVQDDPRFVGDVNERTGQVFILVPQSANITNLDSVLENAIKLPGDPGIYPFSFEGTLGESYDLSSFKLREDGTHHAVRLEKGFTDEEYSDTHEKLQDFRTKVKDGAIYVAQISAVSEGHYLKDKASISEFETRYGDIVENVDIKISQEDGKFPKGSLWTTINGIDLPISRNKLSEDDINIIDEYVRLGTNREYVELILGKAKRNGLFFDTKNGVPILMHRSKEGVVVEVNQDTDLDDLYTYLVSTYYSFNKEAFAGNDRITLPDGGIVSYRSFIKGNLTLGIGFFTETQPDGNTKVVTQPSNRYMVFDVNPKETQIFEEEFAKVEEIMASQGIEETVSPLPVESVIEPIAEVPLNQNPLTSIVKFTMKTAPTISVEDIDLEKSGLEEMPVDGDTQIRLLEVRGRNANGVIVGTVWVKTGNMKDGTLNVFTTEVFFNDPENATVPTTTTADIVDSVARLFGIENTLPDVTETLGNTTQFISDGSGKRIIYKANATRYQMYEERLHAIMSEKLLNDQSSLIEGMGLRQRAIEQWEKLKRQKGFSKSYSNAQTQAIEYSLGLHPLVIGNSDNVKVVEFLHRGISDPSTVQFLSSVKGDNLIDRIVKFLSRILTELGLSPSLFVEVLELNHRIFTNESKPSRKKARGDVDFFTLNTLSTLDKNEIVGIYDWAASKLLMVDAGRVLRLVTTSFNAEKFIAGLHKTLNDSGFGTYVSTDNVKLWADESKVFRFNRNNKEIEFENKQEDSQEGMEGGFLIEETKSKDKFGERKMSVQVSDYASNAIKTFLGLTVEKSEGLPKLSDFGGLYAKILSKSEGIRGQSPEQFLMFLNKSNIFQAPQILNALHLKGFDLEKELKDFTLTDFELSPDADRYNRDLYIQLYQAFHKPETPVEIQREEVEKKTYVDEYDRVITKIKRVYYVTHRNTGSNVDRIKESFQKKFQEGTGVVKSQTSGDMVATPHLVDLIGQKIKQLLAQHEANRTSEAPKNKIVAEIFELLGVTFHENTLRSSNFYGSLTGPIIASELDPVGKFAVNSFHQHIKYLSESNEGLNDPIRQLTRRNQSIGTIKLAGFAKFINQAMAIEGKNNETLPAMMAINAAGEKESGFILPNTFSMITNGINSIGKKEYVELDQITPEAAKANPEAMERYKKKRKFGNLFTPFAKVSETLARVREGQKVEWINYSGVEGQGSGDKTTNLTPSQWILMNIVSMTDTGTMEIMRTQSSSSAFAWKLKDSNANLITSHAQFREVMWNYYNAERSIPNDGNWKFFQDSDSRLFMEGGKPLDVDRSGFNSWLDRFVTGEKNNLVELLHTYNITPSNLAQAVTKPFELSVAEKLLSQVEQDKLIAERIVNSFVLNQLVYHIETSILFYGNLGWFKDPHKRFNALTSGGITPVESASVDANINEEFSLGHAIGKPFKAGDTFNVVIGQEDEFTPANAIHNQLNAEQFEDVLLGELDRFESINGTLTELERDSFLNEKRIELRPAFEKAYSRLTVGDGQSHINLDFWRASLIKVGNWSEKAQDFYEYQVSYYLKKRGLPLSAERQEKFDNYRGGFNTTSLKFMYFGPVMEYGEQNPISFIKTSFNVLIPSVVDGTDLWDTMETMLKNEIHVKTYPSAQKSGIQRRDGSIDTPLKVAKMTDGSLRYNGEISQHFNAYFKEQIHTGNKLKKNSNRGSQWLKLITSNIKQNGKFISSNMETRYNRWLEVVDRLTDIATQEVYGELGITETPDGVMVDKRKLIDRLLKEEDNDDTVIDFLNQNKEFMERTGSTELEIPFEMSMLKQEIGNLIQGIVNKNIVRQKVYGEPLVQVASSGYTNESTRGTQLQRFTKPTGEQVERYTRNGLRWYKRQDGRTETAQCKIALVNEWVNLLNHPLVLEQIDLGMDGLRALNQLLRDGKLPRELTEFAAYRIPTQGLNSMDVFEVAEFLPPSAGNIIIMPAETVAKSGSDYDIDKMYTVMPHISKDGMFVNRGNETSESPFKEKSKLQNEMLELAKEFVLDPLNYSPLVQPDGTDIIEEEVLNIFRKVFPTAREDYKGMGAVSFKGNFLVRMAYLTGKKLLGIPAVANTIFQLYNTGGLRLNPRELDGKPVQPLLDNPRLNFDNGISEDGRSISRVISSHISAFVDIAKDVKFGYAGMNMENLGMVMYQIMLGVPYNRVLTLINQPVIHSLQSKMREKDDKGQNKSYWRARSEILASLVKKLGYPVNNDYALPSVVYRNIEKILVESRNEVDNLLLSIIEKKIEDGKVSFVFNLSDHNVVKLNTDNLYANIRSQGEMLREVQTSTNKDFIRGQIESLLVYDQLQGEASFMFNGQQTVNHDTSLSIDPISATKKLGAMQQVEADGFITKESLESARQNVVVRSLDKNKLLVDLFVDALPVNYSRELIGRGLKLAGKFLKRANRRKKETFYKTFANDFLEYAIKTNVMVKGMSFNEYVSSILPGIRSRIKAENSTNPNILLTDLRYEKDFLRLRVDKDNTGVYYEAFLNLNRTNPALAKDIATLAIGRYGYNKQFYSFSEIIPPAIIKEIVRDFGDNTNLDEFVDLFEVIHGPYFLENKAMFRGYKEYGGRLEAFAPETSMDGLVEPVNYYEDNYSEDPDEYMGYYEVGTVETDTIMVESAIVIFGHPGIGKTFLRETRNDFIDLDHDYKEEHTMQRILRKHAENTGLKEDMDAWENYVKEWWAKVKLDAKRDGKIILVSNLPIIRMFPNEIDKVITMSVDTFIKRSKQRNDYKEGETESWKRDLDIEINKIDRSKVIVTDKYLAELFDTLQSVTQPVVETVKTPTPPTKISEELTVSRSSKQFPYVINLPSGVKEERRGYKITVEEHPNTDFYMTRNSEGKWQIEDSVTGLAFPTGWAETMVDVIEQFKEDVLKHSKTTHGLTQLKKVGMFSDVPVIEPISEIPVQPSNTTDTFKYYGAFYTLDIENGIATNVQGYKGKQSDMSKILGAYNYNKNVDPQNGKPFREVERSQNNMTTIKSENKVEVLNEGQKLAKTKALTILKAPVSQDIMDDMFLISGAGGTGKTYTVGDILREVKGNIWYAAPTWNATNELKANLPYDKDRVVTLASLLGTTLSEPKDNGEQDFILYSDNEIESRRDRGLLPAIFKVGILVIDEASMIGGDGKAPVKQTRREYNPQIGQTEEIVEYVTTDSWEAIKFRLVQREALGMGRPSKILFMGDYAQIPPVGTTRDRDAFIIEHLMGIESQNAVLTQNMRTGKGDLLALHELYRVNIDVANAAIIEGKTSNESIPVTPNPLAGRRNSNSVKYENDLEVLTDKFVAQFRLDTTNVKNTVLVNYNKYSRPETQNLVSKIRAKLFGNNLREIEKGELLILGKDLEVKVKGKEYSFKNDTRFIVTNVVEAQKELVGYVSGVYLKGNDLTLVTQVEGNEVTFNQFVPLKGEIERVFGPYRKDVKGYVIDDRVIKYGDYKKITSTYAPSFNYGYVVNSHKVQGSTYNTVFVDEQNILKSPATNKEKNQLVYTAISRPRQEVHIYHPSNPDQIVDTNDTEKLDICDTPF